MYIEVRLSQYISGRVAGELIHAPVSIESLIIPSQVVGVAENIDIPLFGEVLWDGIVGLAYANVKMRERGLTPLMDTLMSEGLLESNVFSYWVSKGAGAITFGGVNQDYVNEAISPVWVPLLETRYWTLQLLNVHIDGEPLIGAFHRPIKAVVDTGTYLIYGPSSIIEVHARQTILKLLSLQDCEKSTLPVISFVFSCEGTPCELSLHPEDYVIAFENEDSQDCVIGLAADSDQGDWTLGQVFLSPFVTAFDRSQDRIGFMHRKIGL